MVKNDRWIIKEAEEGMLQPFQPNLVRHLEPNSRQKPVLSFGCSSYGYDLRLSAKEFLSILKEKINLSQIVCGPDFALGRNREGTIEKLNILGSEIGFTVEIVPVFSLSEVTKYESTNLLENIDSDIYSNKLIFLNFGISPLIGITRHFSKF